MGNLLIVNFGTFTETNRFKTSAFHTNFIRKDPMYRFSTGGLVRPEGLREVRKPSLNSTYSFNAILSSVWQSNLSGGKFYKDAFKTWMQKVVDSHIECAYMTGHHWDDHRSHRFLVLSSEEETRFFHMLVDTSKRKLFFGISRDRIEVDTSQLRSKCLLVFGVGCNVATAINSKKYQKFFSDKGPFPIILGWDQKSRVPRHNERSVAERFFTYIERYAKGDSKVPTNDRLKWFYNNEPMELIRAWGYAITFWRRGLARARDQNGKFYKFKYNKKKKVAEPVQA